MVSKKEITTLGRLATMIREDKKIKRRKLILLSNISISYCEKLLPFLPELFKDIVYDKVTNSYQVIQTNEVNS